MNTIDLFSGAGGLSLGLKKAGAKILASVEKSRDAVATYALHAETTCQIFNQDIRQIDFSIFKGKVDLVAGGPPCQPFSLGGLRKANKDQRDMIPEFIRCLSEVRPEAFIMENVPGLISKKTRGYFDKTLDQLSKLNYRLNWSILNAADYGVPQKRRRLFILGFKDGILRFPRPTHGTNTKQQHIKSFDVIGLEPLGEAPNCVVKFAKDPDLRPNPYAGQLYNGGGRPIDPHGPCHTILASSGGHKTHWIDTKGVAVEYFKHLQNGGKPWEGEVPGARRLSVEECSRIQTFPNGLVFQGMRSSQYTQVGDAVPVVLAQALASSVFFQLASRNHADNQLLDPDVEVLHFQPTLAI